jgi:hypothetical protein
MSAGKAFQRIWSKYTPLIALKLKQAILKNEPQQIALDSFDFTTALGTKTAAYRFSLDFVNGATSNSMKMTNVAREFADALNANDTVKGLIRKGRFTFKMGSDFKLSIEKHPDEVSVES